MARHGTARMQGNGNGVIPAHRSKGVEFAFCPSLAGTFAESLSVTNALDETNTQVITIKAKVQMLLVLLVCWFLLSLI